MEKPFPAYQGEEPFIFVCYAHSDMDVVYPELQWLHEQGVHIWYDEGVRPGHRWSDDLANAIDGASQVFYFVTPNSVSSENCLDEIGFALDRDTRVLPIFLDPAELPPGLQLRVGSRQFINRFDLSVDAFRSKLLDAVNVDTTHKSTQSKPLLSLRTHSQWWKIGVMTGIVISISFVIMLGTSWRDPEQTNVRLEHRRLTFSGDARNPTISPDGAFVAYLSDNKVVVHDVVSGQSSAIFDHDGFCPHLRWQPNSANVLVSCRTGEESKVHVIPRLGGSARSFDAGGFVTWVPRSNQFATARQNSKGVVITDLSTGTKSTIELDIEGGWLNDLDWSPNGEFIAVLTGDTDLSSRIHLTDQHGEFIDVLVSEKGRVRSPRWSRDGQFVYYLKQSNAAAELWRIDVETRHQEFLMIW